MQRKSTAFPLIALTLLLVLVGLLAFGASPVASAQDASATPETPSESAVITDTEVSTDTEAMSVTADMVSAPGEAPQAYLSLDLAAGFALDPFFVSVNGGGDLDAATVADGCVGMVSENPLLMLDWEGETDLARFFFHSDHNSSLVVQLPDGSYQCADDAGPMLLDAQVELTTPMTGVYSVWVGNEDGEGLIPGVLVLTTRDDVSVDMFELDPLVKRPRMPMAADLDETGDGTADARIVTTNPGAGAINEFVQDMDASEELRVRLAERLAAEEGLELLDDGVTLSASAVLSGELPGFLLPVNILSPQPLCSGISNADSVLDFTVAEGVESFRVFVESSADSTLNLLTPNGDFLCTDETPDQTNRNPLIDVENPAPGNYAVVVGRLGVDDIADANVTVTTDMTLEPVLLEPATPAPQN